MNERGTRKSRKYIGTPQKEKDRYAAYGVRHSCWHFHPLPLLSPLICSFSHPTLSRKERFPEFKGNKQVIKRFKAIMYLKSGSLSRRDASPRRSWKVGYAVYSLRPYCPVGDELLESVFISKMYGVNRFRST